MQTDIKLNTIRTRSFLSGTIFGCFENTAKKYVIDYITCCGEGTNPVRVLAVVRVDVAVVEVHVPTAGSRCIRYLSLSRLITGGMPNK